MNSVSKLPRAIAKRSARRLQFSTTAQRCRFLEGEERRPATTHNNLSSECKDEARGPDVASNTLPIIRVYSDGEPFTDLLKRQRKIRDNFSPGPLKLLKESLAEYLDPENIIDANARFCEAYMDFQPEYFLPLGAFQSFFGNGAHSIKSFTSDGGEAFHYPGPPFERRVWAGGSIVWNTKNYHKYFQQPTIFKNIVRSKELGCFEKIENVEVKGSSLDPKLLVSIDRLYGSKVHFHSAASDAFIGIKERRDLVFMRSKTAAEALQDVTAPDRIIKPPSERDFEIMVRPEQPLLTVFSCLTFNCHRIHIDRGHAASEGYRNTLVHGPLSLTMTLHVLQGLVGHHADVVIFEYRNLAPLYCDENMKICVKVVNGDLEAGDQEEKWSVWIEGEGGGYAVKGTAIIRKRQNLELL